MSNEDQIGRTTKKNYIILSIYCAALARVWAIVCVWIRRLLPEQTLISNCTIGVQEEDAHRLRIVLIS